MPNRSVPRMLAALAAILMLTMLPMTSAIAQDATPAPEDAVTAVASGLSAPRGFTWGPDGTLYVAQSGPGNDADATGPRSSVVKIVDGCPVPVAGGLPSTSDPFGDVLGPMDVQFVGPQLYILQTATGPYGEGSPTPPRPNGIYTAGADGTVTLWLDLTSYIDSYPPTNMPGDYNPLGEPYRMLFDGDGFWVVDANRGLVLFIDMNKKIRRVADLSLDHPVLTAITLDHQGGIYVGNLTPAPHADGTSWVKHIDRKGNTQTVWTDLTVVTGLAVDSDNQLYALEMATGNLGPEGMRPGTGRLLKQTGPDTYDIVAYGLEYPIDLEFGPDGDFYVSMPSYGPNTQSGLILRIPSDAANLTVDLAQFDGYTCADATGYQAPAPIPPGSPTPDGTPKPAG